MIDKKIIIDEIDISGCPSYMDNGECINENIYPDYCKACFNCTYKLEQRLKHKEKECERLKAEVKKQKEISKEYERRWLNSYGV